MALFFQDAMNDYFEKKKKGELLVQKLDFLKQNILQPVT